ncbi:SRPBCC domain-containing protein [Leptospira sp. 96542]|nr:SRPBCC domain-containing protein [Leptospira sp. 96542]
MERYEAKLSIEDRIVRIERRFDAPLPLVWEVWINPLHISKWWGPKTFTVPNCTFDFQVGGAYRIVMRSPEGVDYPVTGKFISIEPMKKFVMTDLVDEHPEAWVKEMQKQTGIEGAKEILNSELTVLFEEDSEQTKVTLITKFANNDIRDGFAKSGMKEGWSESFDKLEDLALPKKNQVIIAKEMAFDQKTIYQTFLNPKTVHLWWGPNGFTLTTHSMDVSVGGSWVYTMHGPDGTDYPNRILYKELNPYEFISYLHGTGIPDANDDFSGKVSFIKVEEFKTKIIMQMDFADESTRNNVLKFGAVEGGKQTLAKLEKHLEEKK